MLSHKRLAFTICWSVITTNKTNNTFAMQECTVLAAGTSYPWQNGEADQLIPIPRWFAQKQKK